MMCKNINKKTRGFSLVELMVVVAIMGTLAAIAIPAYNEYRKSAKKAAYKSDLNSLHKGWLAFGVELDSFCERETSPERATIANVGMQSLLSSKLYGQEPGKINFIGFAAQDHASFPCVPTPTVTLGHGAPHQELAAGAGNDGSGAVAEDQHCVVGISEYKMGVFGHFGGNQFIGHQIDENGVVFERNATTGNPTGLETTCV